MKSSRMKKILAVILCLTLGLSTNMLTMAESTNSPAVQTVQEEQQTDASVTTDGVEVLTETDQTVTETPTPTATSEPTPTPEVTMTPTPEATPEVIATPTPETTPEATATPTPGATPTEVPETPEPTVEPTQTPQVTEVPTSTPEITTTPTPGATDEVIPTPDAEEDKLTETSESEENTISEDEKIDINSLTVEEIYSYLSGIKSDEKYIQEWDALNDEKEKELIEYITKRAISGEITVDNSNGAINFSEAAPLVANIVNSEEIISSINKQAVVQNNNFNTTDQESVDGVDISKQIKNYDSESGIGTLQLEAFVTGNVEIEQKTVPTDIVLVLDQSGSMAESFGQEEKYDVASEYENQTAYEYTRYNTLYAENGGEYVEVNINRYSTGQQEYVEQDRLQYSQLYNGRNTPYYYRDTDGNYHELNISQEWSWSSFSKIYTIYYDREGQRQYLVTNQSDRAANFTVYTLETKYSYTYTYTGANEEQVTETSEGATGRPPYDLYIRTTVSVRALDSLANAVENFVSNVQTNANETNADHRIAIVGFASNTNTYENTEILTGVTIEQGGQKNNADSRYYPTGYAQNGALYNSRQYTTACGNALQSVTTNSTNIQAAIDALTAEGGTQTDHGIDMAVDIFNAQSPSIKNAYASGERKKVVIVFTDGEPTGNGNSWSNPTANNAVSYAKTLKENNTTVYSVGIFSGADGRVVKNWRENPEPARNTGANLFMHLLSSNYPEATSYSNNWAHGSIAELEPIENPTEETGDYNSYFLSAEDSEGLNDVFDSIYDEIGGADVSLNSTTVLNDVLSDYFILPEGIDKDDIKVYTADCTSVTTGADGQNQYTFGTPTEYAATVSVSGKTINVSGFDYSANYVGLRKGVPGGKKLIVEIPIQLDNSAVFGGNNIPTNQPTSGIYNAAGNECYGNFEKPIVNVPIDYDFAAKSQTIYLKTAAKLQQILRYVNDYEPDGINNKFVTIEYSLNDSNGDRIGTFTIPAGVAAGNGTWTLESDKSFEPSDLETCTDYFLKCTVSPSEVPIQKIFGEVAVTTDLDPQKATVHVLVPQIECSDTTVFINDIVDLEDRYDSSDSDVTWVDEKGDNRSDADAPIITDEPTVDITPVYVSGTMPSDGDYRPQEDSNFKLNVTISGTDVTDNCKIDSVEQEHTDDCIRNDNGTKKSHDFTIHVVAGSIKINKTLTNDEVNKNLEGNPVFTFRIDYLGEGDSKKTFYRTIEFEEDDGISKSAEILSGLPRGTYTVTELSTQKFNFDSLKVEEGTTCEYTNLTNSVVFQIGTSGESGTDTLGKTGEVTFTNEKVGPSTNTDTDVIVNRFVYEGGKWTIKQIRDPGYGQTESTPGVTEDTNQPTAGN